MKIQGTNGCDNILKCIIAKILVLINMTDIIPSKVLKHKTKPIAFDLRNNQLIKYLLTVVAELVFKYDL